MQENANNSNYLCLDKYNFDVSSKYQPALRIRYSFKEFILQRRYTEYSAFSFRLHNRTYRNGFSKKAINKNKKDSSYTYSPFYF